jgi:hypothetical protein
MKLYSSCTNVVASDLYNFVFIEIKLFIGGYIVYAKD